MRLGFAISVFLHTALLAWALVSLAEPREFKVPDPEPVTADVISESELTQLRQGSRTATLDNAMAKDVLKPDVALKDVAKPKPVQAAPPPPPPAEEAEAKQSQTSLLDQIRAMPTTKTRNFAFHNNGNGPNGTPTFANRSAISFSENACAL